MTVPPPSEQYPESLRREAADRVGFILSIWIHRFERILQLPGGHLWPFARNGVPAFVFADFLARMRERVGLTPYEPSSPLDPWHELVATAGLEALASLDPQGQLPRGLASKAVVHAMGFTDVRPLPTPFIDVPLDHVAWKEIATLRHLGIEHGWYDGLRFQPDQRITMFETAKVLSGAFVVRKLGPVSPTKVFLSHSSRDKMLVRELKAALARRRVSVWLDEERLPPGVDLLPRLAAEIADPNIVVIAVVSKHSLASGPVEEELKLALAAARSGRPKVLPFVIDDVELPPVLGGLTGVRFDGASADSIVRYADLERAVELLLTAIEDVDLEAALAL